MSDPIHLLLVKISSMGDVLHALPAVSDVKRHLPHARISWVVEEGYAMIPAWHPGVEQVIPTALRRWRRQPWRGAHWGEAGRLLGALRQEGITHVVDAQGLLKSALLARSSGKPCWGPDRDWVRERLALPLYHHRVGIQPGEHVIARIRRLCAAALGYPLPTDPPRFGLDPLRIPPPPVRVERPFYLFLHGTAWTSKLWPESYWVALARLALADGKNRVLLPWGNAPEKARAERIAAQAGYGAGVLPALSIAGLAALLLQARGAVGLDSGFAHMAAALDVPCVTLFGATNPDYSGIAGPGRILLRSSHPCAPCMKRQCPTPDAGNNPDGVTPACFQSIPPERVWEALRSLDG